jgi:hypothetical protein
MFYYIFKNPYMKKLVVNRGTELLLDFKLARRINVLRTSPATSRVNAELKYSVAWISSAFIMSVDVIVETLVFISTLTRLIAPEDFSASH